MIPGVARIFSRRVSKLALLGLRETTGRDPAPRPRHYRRKRACALDQLRSAGGRAAPGDLGPVSALNAGGPCRAGGTIPGPKTSLKTLFFQKLQKHAQPTQACFWRAKSKRCSEVAENVRNVFRTTSRTWGVQIGPSNTHTHTCQRQSECWPFPRCACTPQQH